MRKFCREYSQTRSRDLSSRRQLKIFWKMEPRLALYFIGWVHSWVVKIRSMESYLVCDAPNIKTRRALSSADSPNSWRACPAVDGVPKGEDCLSRCSSFATLGSEVWGLIGCRTRVADECTTSEHDCRIMAKMFRDQKLVEHGWSRQRSSSKQALSCLVF